MYLVVGELRWKDTKSFIGVRFAREDVDRARINFPGIASFPLRAGDANTLFSCLHNANAADVSNGRLSLRLSDASGRTIAEHSYDGVVTSAMMGVASAFVPAQDYDSAVLEAKLYQDTTLVDEVRIVYDCTQIDPSQCAPRSMLHVFLETLGMGTIYVIVGLGGVVLCGAAWIIRRSRARASIETTNQS